MLVALGVVYSLGAPWLAQRALASATTIAQVKRAHSYDPLSTDALTEWAALRDAQGDTFGALKLYRDAVALEPESSDTWWALGSFYYEHQALAAGLRRAREGLEVRPLRAGGRGVRAARPGAPRGARRLAA